MVFENYPPIFYTKSQLVDKFGPAAGAIVGPAAQPKLLKINVNEFYVDKQTLKMIKVAMVGLKNKSHNSVFFDPSDHVDQIEQQDIQKVLDAVTFAYDSITES